MGRLDTETLIIEYSDVTKSIVTYDDNGEVVNQEPQYENGTGTIIFNDDGTFIWHEDQSVYGTDWYSSGRRLMETEKDPGFYGYPGEKAGSAFQTDPALLLDYS